MILTKEEKLKYVKAYKEGQTIPTPEGFESRRAFKNSLLNWVKRYNKEGEKGLDRKRPSAKRRIPTAEEKLAIVLRIQNGERSIDVARETGFSQGAISNWCRNSSILAANQVEYSPKEGKAMPDTEEKKTPEEKIRELEAENMQLKAENAVLKKSIALKVMKKRQQRRQG
jgi:transposase